MQPWGEVSSIRGANTRFEGHQINGQTHRERREDTHRREITEEQITEERSKERPETQIKGDPRSRAEEPRPLRDTTSEGPSTLLTKIVVTTSGVVNKEV
jgi:hypothetical protein